VLADGSSKYITSISKCCSNSPWTNGLFSLAVDRKIQGLNNWSCLRYDRPPFSTVRILFLTNHT
jgi:hypothetical protein